MASGFDTPSKLNYTAAMLKLKLLPAILLLVALTGCEAPTPPPSPTPWPTNTFEAERPPTSAVQVVSPVAGRMPEPALTPTVALATLSVWENLPPAQAEQLAQEIEDFQARFSQYRVDLHHYNSPEEFLKGVSSQTVDFDIVLAAPPLLGSLQAMDRLAPLADFFPPSFLGAFEAVTLAGVEQEGQWWGLPDTTGFHLLLFYNRDLIDSPPHDTDALARLPDSLAGEAAGLGLNSYDPLWLLPWLSAYGGWLTDEAGSPSLDTEPMVAALTLYLDWHQSKAPLVPITTYHEMQTNFLNGNLATVIDGEWAIRELAGTNRVSWSVAPLPRLSQSGESAQPPAPLVLGRYWAISAGDSSGDQVLAITAFLDLMTRSERQLAWTAQFGLLPTRRDVLDAPLIISDPILRASVLQMKAGRTVPLGVNVNLLLDAMRPPLRDALAGDLTPAEAAAAMQARAEELLLTSGP